MTFDDDLLELHFDVGTQRIPAVTLGLEWPPPERYDFTGHEDWMVRISMSEITDEMRASMTNVARCAVYEYE